MVNVRQTNFHCHCHCHYVVTCDVRLSICENYFGTQLHDNYYVDSTRFILEPLLFLIYINDLPLVSQIFDMIKYADDTTLYCNIKRDISDQDINAELKYIPLCFVDMCGVEGKRRLCDLNVTSSSPALATRHIRYVLLVNSPNKFESTFVAIDLSM